MYAYNATTAAAFGDPSIQSTLFLVACPRMRVSRGSYRQLQPPQPSRPSAGTSHVVGGAPYLCCLWYPGRFLFEHVTRRNLPSRHAVSPNPVISHRNRGRIRLYSTKRWCSRSRRRYKREERERSRLASYPTRCPLPHFRALVRSSRVGCSSG